MVQQVVCMCSGVQPGPARQQLAPLQGEARRLLASERVPRRASQARDMVRNKQLTYIRARQCKNWLGCNGTVSPHVMYYRR